MIVNCLHDALVPVAELKPHPKNRNAHPADQITRLASILKYQGWRYPVKVSKRSGYITSGHGRLAAAKEAGWDKVPVNYQDYADEAQEYADLQSDNAIAEWAELDIAGISNDLDDLPDDFDLSLLGIKDFEAKPVKPDVDEDSVPEEVEDPGVERGDIFQLGEHRLMCGDATEDVDRLLDGAKVDMVYTDPPYGIDIVATDGTIGGGNVCAAGNYDQITGDKTIDAARSAYQVCVDLGVKSICFWGGNYFTEFLPPKMGWIVWDKRGDLPSNNFSDCEMAWTNRDKAARCYKQTWSGMIKEGENAKRVHPTQKPTALAEFCLKEMGGGSTLDLFGGSGSTLIACEKTNRKCYMMEIEPKYCRVIIDRWEQYTGKKAEKVNAKD